MELSFKHKLSHLGSCLTSLPIIQDIYSRKLDDEVFILSNGHAGLALYVILEARYGLDAEALLEKHGIHPNRDLPNRIFCSTGSLGSGLPIAVGHAIADRNKKVYCLISDGESAEGSVWESLRFIQVSQLTNLEVYVNVNGFSAFDVVDIPYLVARLKAFLPNIIIHQTVCNEFPSFLSGLLAHYYVMKPEDWEIVKATYEKNLC